MKRADRDDESRVRARRQRVACEAARLIAQSGLQDYHQAKLKAAQALGILDDASLPRNIEVRDQLRDYQRLFQSEEQPRALRLRREAALQAMDFFERFEPRLVGSVLDGTADANSPVVLHVFSDDPELIARLLLENRLNAVLRERKLDIGRDQTESFPAWQFSIDGIAFEVVVLPMTLLRQAPVSSFDGKPMQRATTATLRRLLAEDGG